MLPHINLWIWSWSEICVPRVIFLFLVILTQKAYSVTLLVVASVQILACLFNIMSFELAKSQPNIKAAFIMLSWRVDLYLFPLFQNWRYL